MVRKAGTVFVYFGETEKINEELLLKIKVKNKKIKIHAEIAKELWAKDGPAEVETAGEKMKTTELLRIAMLYKTQIYKIKSIPIQKNGMLNFFL